MRLTASMATAALALAGAAQAQPQGDSPPKVVATSPANGAEVAPSLAELKVSYDHRMAASWSFATGGEHAFPQVLGPPRLSDDRITVTLPIRLEPHRSYVVWLNTAGQKNFKGENGQAAEPYRLSFKTTD